MEGMPMPGGGPPWPVAAVSFLGMWLAMMAAMMLPSLLPALWRYRQALGGTSATRRTWLTVVVGLGYLSVWTALGAVVFPVSVGLAAVEMPAIAAGVVVIGAGALQLTGWKAHHLACFRVMPPRGQMVSAEPGASWRHGIRLGIHCSASCAGLTAALLAVGMTNVQAMVAVTAAITVERLAPAGERVARGIGVAVVAIGSLMLASAVR
jgi:predicted metal-binding membrane protein